MTPRMIQGILVGVVIGIAVGIGAYTFAYAKGWSYLTDDPAACANCHVMREQFDAWLSSSHRSVAGGNSCQIKPHSRVITEQACRNCHGEIVDAIEATHPASTGEQVACLSCHNSVGHLQ